MSRRRSSEDAPVSLFAFQDIITSITGIMILVVLMQVLEVVSRKAAEAPPLISDGETAPKQVPLDKLEKRKNELEAQLQKGVGILGKFIEIDPEQLVASVRAEEARKKKLRRRAAAAREQIKAAEREESKGDDGLEPEIEEEKRTLALIRTQIRDAKGKPIDIFVPGPMDKRPILVECAKNGLRVQVAGETERPLPFSSKAFTDDFIHWARKRSKTQEAFFLLLKPSFAPYAEVLITLVRNEGFALGYEPFEEKRTAVLGKGVPG